MASPEAREKSVPQPLEKDTGGIFQQRPISDESEVSDDVAEVTEDADQSLTSELPFSNARCIALVATLTGASFLNVSPAFRNTGTGRSGSLTGTLTAIIDVVGAGRGHHPSDHRQGPRHTGGASPMDPVGLFSHIRMFHAFLGQGRRHLWEAQDLPVWLRMVRCHDTRQSFHSERDSL